MILLKIVKIDENENYTLQNTKTKQKHNLVLEFVDTPQPKIGDILFLHPSLVKIDGVHIALASETCPFGKQELADQEIIVLKSGEQKIFLKRVYG